MEPVKPVIPGKEGSSSWQLSAFSDPLSVGEQYNLTRHPDVLEGLSLLKQGKVPIGNYYLSAAANGSIPIR